MAVEKSTKRLFCIRIYPDSAPPSIVALLAGSESEAETIARGRAGLATAPAFVRECPDDDSILVTFS
jgi:hypothetical protein